ncbi:hypothetical protein Tco_1490513 [Tanacetum coccineum]
MGIWMNFHGIRKGHALVFVAALGTYRFYHFGKTFRDYITLVCPIEDDYDRGCRKLILRRWGFKRGHHYAWTEYVTGIDDEGEVTFKECYYGYIDEEELEVLSFETIEIHGSIHLMKNWGRSRKAHLLEDKQIPSVGVFDEEFLALGWHLEEIHVTWAYLKKKRTRLQTYTKSFEELCKQHVETVSQA